MESNVWVEQLYADTSLTNHLQDEDAEQVHRWAESYLATVTTEDDAMRLLDAVRLLNRYVMEGGMFEQLFTALRANSIRTEGESPIAPPPGDLAPEIDTLYPRDTDVDPSAAS